MKNNNLLLTWAILAMVAFQVLSISVYFSLAGRPPSTLIAAAICSLLSIGLVAHFSVKIWSPLRVNLKTPRRIQIYSTYCL